MNICFPNSGIVRFGLMEKKEKDPFTQSELVFHSPVGQDVKHYGGTACVFLCVHCRLPAQPASIPGNLNLLTVFCIPLDLYESRRITLDETSLLLAEKGSCLRAAEEKIPLLKTFEPELRCFLGDKKYEKLVRLTGSK